MLFISVVVNGSPNKYICLILLCYNYGMIKKVKANKCVKHVTNFKYCIT